MTFSFHPEADEELAGAVEYYESCSPGLGMDLLREVYATVQNVIDYPMMWPELVGGIRRCLVHRFPFGILYCIEQGGIYILAVMPLHRDPEYWKRRMRED